MQQTLCIDTIDHKSTLVSH